MRTVTTLFIILFMAITTASFANLVNVVSFQSPTIDFTQTQMVPLVTTDEGTRFVVQSIAAHCDSFEDVLSPVINGSWGWNAPDYVELGCTTLSMTEVDQYHLYSGFEGTHKSIPQNSQLFFNLTTAAQGINFTGKIIVTGFYD